MEFIDYYEILNLNQSCPQNEVKQAFKAQAKKWHPDKNPNSDTTQKMQLINEAFLILNDPEARARYDIEYQRYMDFSKKSSIPENKTYDNEHNQAESTEFSYHDEVLKNWVANARRQAQEYVARTIKEVGELSVTATKAAGHKMIEMFLTYLVLGIIISLLIKACGGI